MATWKKVIVSGSDAILNQVTASGGFSGDGSGLTGISADSLGNSLTDGNGIVDFTFNGSAGATVAVQVSGSTLEVGTNGVRVADGGIDTAQIAAGAVETAKIEDLAVTNAKLANDGITIAGSDISLGGSITAAAIGTAIGAFSGSAQVTGITVGQMAANSIDSDQYVDGSIDTDHIGANQVTNAKLQHDGITIAGVDTSLGGTITAATIGNAIGAFSGSAQVTGITVGQMASNSVDTAQIAAGAVETAKIDDLAVTTAKIADNAVTGDKLSDDVTIANNLTVTGDLIVSGDTVTVNTTNLNVEDRFILLNSGSINTDVGIVFGGTTGTVNTGKALLWDHSYDGGGGADGRLAVSTAAVAGGNTTNFSAGTTGYYVAGVFEGTAANAATALADHNGNIRIESNEIYIYA
jgi:hypothetical protein